MIGTVTVNSDITANGVRKVKATFAGGDGELAGVVTTTKSITIQTSGVFDGATISMQKSNNGVNYHPLSARITQTQQAHDLVSLEDRDLGCGFYKVLADGGGAVQNIVMDLLVNL